MFGMFGKKCPLCGMKEEKGAGMTQNGKWFCTQEHAKKYDKKIKEAEKNLPPCCRGH